MNKFEITRSNLNKLIKSVESYFTHEEIVDIVEYFENEEFGLAFDNVCWLLMEKDVSIPLSVVELVSDLYESMNGNTIEEWKDLAYWIANKRDR
ncbi:MAG: MafI family immunity protein [Oligoflexia bacterium]|nr:MafI family immunity protein [Oligoflexia bacterium]